MFGQKKKTKEEYETEIEDLQSHIQKLEESLENYKTDLKNEQDANKEYQYALQTQKSNFAILKTDLEDHKQGRFYLEGETTHTNQLVHILREELECVHEELRALKKAIRASQMLIEPHISDVTLER